MHDIQDVRENKAEARCQAEKVRLYTEDDGEPLVEFRYFTHCHGKSVEV